MKKIISYGPTILSDNIRLADNLWTRLVGLMFQSIPREYDGLLIDPCRSIHTFFMRYSLDVVFISKDGKIIKIIRDLKPWRMTWIYFKADQVLELPAGKLPLALSEGQLLEVKSV